MAKETKKWSFDDFTEDSNLLNEDEVDQDEVEEVQEQEEEEIVEPPKKKAVKAKKEEEQEIEEEEPKPKPEKKKVVTKKVEPIQEEEEFEEETEEEQEEAPTDAKAFFEEVEKLTGTTLDVDYGDTDPLSPQGVALREKAVKEAALDSFLEEIEQKFPQAFKALQHAYNGGDITELFTQTTGRDYTKIELKEDDTDLAKQILKEYYKSKGVKNEARINKMIEADEDSENGLVKEAQTALMELQEEQEAEKAEILEAQKQKAAEQKKRDQILVTAVDEVLEARRLGAFKISDRMEANEFKKFVVQNIRRTTDGKYELATPLDQANIEKILQYQYFQFKKGDLTKIIQEKARTQNAEQLRLKLKNEQTKTKTTTTGVQGGKLSFHDFVAD